MADKKENQRNRIQFSVIDFIILLLILAGLCGVVLRYDLANRLFSQTALTEARITFVAEAVSPEEAAVFTENTIFYTENSSFGTLTTITSEPAIIFYETSIGALASYEDPKRVDISGSFSSEVLLTDDGYLLNGNTFIAAGSTFTVKAHSASVLITIISINSTAQ